MPRIERNKSSKFPSIATQMATLPVTIVPSFAKVKENITVEIKNDRWHQRQISTNQQKLQL